MNNEALIILDESYLSEMAELYKISFAGEPWNDDWSDRNQLYAYVKDISGSFNSLNFGLKKDGKLAAMSLGTIRHWWEGTNYNLDELCVAPEYQGQGLGTYFMGLVEEEIRKLGYAGIFLQTDNDKPAYSFYHKIGFNDLGAHVSLYKSLAGRIELAVEEDREEILALYRKQIGQQFCPWTDEYPGNDTIDFDFSRDALYVMKENGRVIAAISIEEDEEVDRLDCWSSDLAPAGELARLAVQPERQGQGIARKMLQRGMDELKKRGFKSIHFLVNKHNIKAIRSYERFNFNIVGECHMFDQNFWCYEKEL